ncbi:MAG: hypothetical protein O2971_03820 [Proteobacteria bacterium]|nr:hypothetical protein [Pseudomonadota bacterium]
MSEEKPRFKHADVWISVTTNIFVIASVIFLALEIQQNNSYLRRSEVNATMDQSSALREATFDREFAEMLVRARENPESLDAVDRLRVGNFYSQAFWSSWQIYDRERGGYVDEGEWSRAGRGIVLGHLATQAGRDWWNRGMNVGMPLDFIELVNNSFDEAVAARNARQAQESIRQ